MADRDDHVSLAAEYALGTLDAAERAQVEAMTSIDADFKAVVEAWERKLGVLNQMVGPVEPRAEVWESIRAAIRPAEPLAPLALPEAAAELLLHPPRRRPMRVPGRLRRLATSPQLHEGRRGAGALSRVSRARWPWRLAR